MAFITVTNTLVNGNTADAGELNTNFSDIISGTSDGTKDINISALTCASTATFNGNTTLGNATSDTVTFTARVASSILPSADDTYDLGSSALQWRQLYADDITINATTLVTDAANGRVGIGTTSPSRTLEISGGSSTAVMKVTSTDTTSSRLILNSVSGDAYTALEDGGTGVWHYGFDKTDGSFKIGTSDSMGANTKMTIDSSGNVGIGTSASSIQKVRILGSGTTSSTYAMAVLNGTPATIMYARDDLSFLTNSGSVDGAISDVRLKENFKPIENSLSVINQLNPIYFDWKFPSSHRDTKQAGFIAQEVQSVRPDWVQKGIASQEEIASGLVKEDDVLTTKLGDLVPYLTKAVQELSAKNEEQKSLIESLVSRIEALEAK